MPKTWMGSKTCDFCGKKEPKVLIDGKTNLGPWAIMCNSCYVKHGVGLGVSKGQKYKRDEEGMYMKVEERRWLV